MHLWTMYSGKYPRHVCGACGDIVLYPKMTEEKYREACPARDKVAKTKTEEIEEIDPTDPINYLVVTLEEREVLRRLALALAKTKPTLQTTWRERKIRANAKSFLKRNYKIEIES